jgi:hypothetical protein
MTVVLFASSRTGPLGTSTPIIVAAGGLIVANADGPADLLDTLTATIQDAQGNIIVPASAVTITEDSDLGTGLWRYVARAVAPLTAGAYQIVWVGSDSTQTASEPVIVEIGVRPSIERVASYIRARTKLKGGAELGTFNAQTRPTDDEVEEFIDDALDEVLGKVQPVDSTLSPGTPMGPGSDYERRVRGAVALYAAVTAELSLQPEQVRNDQSPAALLQARYESRIRALIAEGETGRPEGEGSGGPGGGDAPADAAWTFPDAAPGVLVGWASRW